MYFRQSQDLSNSISLSQVLLMSYLQPTKQKTNSKNLWFERLMAIAATVNLGLVLFDYSYIPWRDFYLRHQFPASTRMPTITDLYDPIKDIEPYRDTSNYLDTVDTVVSQKQVGGKVGKPKTPNHTFRCPPYLYSNGDTFCLKLSCSMSVGTAATP